MKYRFEIPKLPPRSTANRYVVHRAKKEWTEYSYYLGHVIEKLPKVMPGEHRNVTILFESPGPKRDKDNLNTLCKVPLDALKRAGLIHDDSPKFITFNVDDFSARKTRTIIWIETLDQAGAA